MKRVTLLKTRIFTALAVIGSLAGAQAGSFFADFNGGLVPANATAYGNATVQASGGYTNSGYLQLTTTSPGGQNAGFIINDLDAGTPVVSFTASCKVLIGSVGNGADGMSFNFAPDLPAGPISEEGAGTGYSVGFDTFLNAAPDTAPAIDVKVGPAYGDHSAYTGNALTSAIVANLRPNVFVDAVIQLNPNSTLTVVYDGLYVISNLDLSTTGYSPVGGSLFGIGARTGGTTDNHWVDNLNIVTRTSPAPFVNSFAPIGRAVATNSAIDIVLTDNTTQVNTNTIVLKLDGATVTPTITVNDTGDTFLHYNKPGGFALNSTHEVSVVFSDNASPTPQQITWGYTFTTVPPPPVVPTSVVVFSDGFESYVGNSSILDKNYNGSNATIVGPAPNIATNGSGNPWWGVHYVNNAYVVTAGTPDAGAVTPHSGTNMIHGIAPSDVDQIYYNLAYRLREGQVLQGNFFVEWWFYDPDGAGSTTYRDYVAIDYYSGIPGATDYAGTDDTPARGTILQRLSLGAAPNPSAGIDYTKYQARIVSSPLGFGQGNFNTTTTRSIGWHHARIVVGPPTNNTPFINFFVDDVVNPAVGAICPTTQGFNCIEVNLAFGATYGYFDDFSVSLAIPPKLVPTRSGNSLSFNWPAGFTLQSAADAKGPYTDIAAAPLQTYSFDITSQPQQFFRLRN
jgi:hypothetical protein